MDILNKLISKLVPILGGICIFYLFIMSCFYTENFLLPSNGINKYQEIAYDFMFFNDNFVIHILTMLTIFFFYLSFQR